MIFSPGSRSLFPFVSEVWNSPVGPQDDWLSFFFQNLLLSQQKRHTVSLSTCLSCRRCQPPDFNKQAETSFYVVWDHLPSWCFTQLGQWAKDCWSSFSGCGVHILRGDKGLTARQQTTLSGSICSCSEGERGAQIRFDWFTSWGADVWEDYATVSL